MTTFQDLQAEHEALLKRHEDPTDPNQFWGDVQSFIERVRVSAEEISAPRERDQLRAILRFWASYVYDKTGSYPDTTMRPAMNAASVNDLRLESDVSFTKPPTPLPTQRAPLVWGIAAVAVIAFLIAAMALGRSIQPMSAAPQPTEFAPVSTPSDTVNVIVTSEAATRQIEIQSGVLTAGPSPFDPQVWAARLQLTASGGDGTYIFWVNGMRLPDISDNQFTVEGTGCEPQKPVVGVTSGGQATSLELVIQSPLVECQRP